MNLAEQVELPSCAQLEPVGPAKAPALMSFEAFCVLLAQQPGLKELQLQGAGEPLAHPRFFDMVAYAAARGVEVTTTTSLLTISEARIEECVASGLRRIDVAPGASDPSDCDYLRPGSKLRRALRNAQRLAEAKKRHGSEASADPHRADAPATQPGRACGARPARRRARRGVAGIPAPVARRERDAALRRGRIAAQGRPWRGIHVGASGEALPCARLKTPQRLDLGNMRRDGVVRVWNSDAYREFRERLASDDPPDICRGCAVYQGML